MSIRKSLVAFGVAAGALPAFAQVDGTWYPGEIGFAPAVSTSQLTREQVRQELVAFVKQGGHLAAGELIAPVRTAGSVDTATMGNAPAPAGAEEPFVNGGPN